MLRAMAILPMLLLATACAVGGEARAPADTRAGQTAAALAALEPQAWALAASLERATALSAELRDPEAVRAREVVLAELEAETARAAALSAQLDQGLAEAGPLPGPGR